MKKNEKKNERLKLNLKNLLEEISLLPLKPAFQLMAEQFKYIF